MKNEITKENNELEIAQEKVVSFLKFGFEVAMLLVPVIFKGFESINKIADYCEKNY